MYRRSLPAALLTVVAAMLVFGCLAWWVGHAREGARPAGTPRVGKYGPIIRAGIPLAFTDRNTGAQLTCLSNQTAEIDQPVLQPLPTATPPGYQPTVSSQPPH